MYYTETELAQFPIGASASYAYGAPSLTTCANESVSPVSLYRPTGVGIGPGGSLLVSSSLENRVLMYPSPPTENQTPAETVFGQANLYSAVQGADLAHLNSPNHIIYDPANTIWVSDWNQYRVVRYSVVPVQDISSVPVAIQFQGQTPTVAMLPKGTFSNPFILFNIHNPNLCS